MSGYPFSFLPIRRHPISSFAKTLYQPITYPVSHVMREPGLSSFFPLMRRALTLESVFHYNNHPHNLPTVTPMPEVFVHKMVMRAGGNEGVVKIKPTIMT